MTDASNRRVLKLAVGLMRPNACRERLQSRSDRARCRRYFGEDVMECQRLRMTTRHGV